MTASHLRSGRSSLSILTTSAAILVATAWTAHGQFAIDAATGNTAQNFDTLSTSTGQTWINDTTLTPPENSTLDGWSLFTGTNSAITGYSATSGGTTTGSFYSFGADSATDRSLGGIGSGGGYFGNPGTGAVAGYIAFAATNTSTATLTSFTIGFDGEQWRNSGAGAQTMVLEYGFGASFDTVSWIEPGGLFNWTSPVTGGTPGGIDGNSATVGLVSGRGGTVNGLNWVTDETLWVRWIERNDPNSDHGLGIDNFTFSWLGALIETQYWDVNGATADVGGSGTWSNSNVLNVNWNPLATGDGTPENANPSKRLIFAGNGGTITIDVLGVAANTGMQFDAPYTINGGQLTLGSNSSLQVNADISINAPVAGTNGLLKLGTGTLTLGNAVNLFSGDITISGGKLVIPGDGSLGNANNKVILSGGILSIPNTMTLGANRTLTGTGGLEIKPGKTLTVPTVVTVGNLQIASGSEDHTAGGTLVLNGTDNTVGNVLLPDPVTIQAANGLTINGNVTAGSFETPSSITGPTKLNAAAGGLQVFDILDTPADVDFLIDGPLSGTGRLHKTGNGTLRLSGATTDFAGGVRLGTAPNSALPGGRLIIGDKGSLGTVSGTDFQFNDGILEAEVALTGANALPVGVSFGAGSLGPAVIRGMPVEFLGDLSGFYPGGTGQYTHELHLETNVTFRGYGPQQGTGTSTGIKITGTNTLTFAGTAAAASSEPLTVEGPTLVVNGTLANNVISVVSGRLTGGGTVGAVSIGDIFEGPAAILAPGDGRGKLTMTSLVLNMNADLRIEIDRAQGLADSLEVAGSVSLGSEVAKLTLELLGVGSLLPGTEFVIVDNSVGGLTTGNFIGLPDGGTFQSGGIQWMINYDGGVDANDVVLTVVPEPSSILAFGVALGCLGVRRRRRAIRT